MKGPEGPRLGVLANKSEAPDESEAKLIGSPIKDRGAGQAVRHQKMAFRTRRTPPRQKRSDTITNCAFDGGNVPHGDGETIQIKVWHDQM